MIINNIPASVPDDFLNDEQISPGQCIFFDIETTGLSWRRSHLYLLGAVFFENGRWIHRQWFCQKPGEEKEVLEQFSELLNSRRWLIHFNGNTFDVPYLMHKYTFYRIEQSWEHLSHVDIYQRLLPCKKLLGLQHMRQKDLEILAGIHREDPFTGSELISCYQEYLQTDDQRLYKMLILHNQEDVEGMISILPLLSIPRLFQGKLQNIPVNGTEQQDMITLRLSFPKPFPVKIQLETPWYQMDADQETCTLYIPIFEGTLKYFFSNYKDYYYLPLEDEAIHKSVGAYVDKEHREKAKACNCYKKMSGRFLPQFDAVFTPEFHREYKDSVQWFSFNTDFCADSDKLKEYAAHLLQNLYMSRSSCTCVSPASPCGH